MPTEQYQRSRKRTPREASQEENFTRLQPQAPELEAAVLGAIMVDTDAFMMASELLTKDSFYDNRHKLIYEAIADLGYNRQPTDARAVVNKLRDKNELDEVGGVYYVMQLCDGVSGSANLEYNATIVAQKAMARDLISYTSRIQTSAFEEPDVGKLLEKAQAELFDLAKRGIKRAYTHIDPVIEEAITLLEEAAKKEDGMTGVATLFHALDKKTNGWQNSNLIVIAARPAMGKTAFSLCMAKNIAVDQRIPMAFFSLEMSNVELVNRLIANVTEIPNEKLRNGQLEKYEWVQLMTRIEHMRGAPLYIDDTPGLNVFELRTKARRLKDEHDVKIIMIDYLQLMSAPGVRAGNRQEEVSIISRQLKMLAKELEIPIIALSQLSRKVEERNNAATAHEGNEGSQAGNEARRPQLSDLRESGAIEQDADMVLFIHRPEKYGVTKDEHGKSLKGIAEIILAKHRNGDTGVLRFFFREKLVRFENLEDAKSQDTDSTVGEQINAEAPTDGAASVYDEQVPYPMDGAYDPLPPAEGNPGEQPF